VEEGAVTKSSREEVIRKRRRKEKSRRRRTGRGERIGRRGGERKKASTCGRKEGREET